MSNCDADTGEAIFNQVLDLLYKEPNEVCTVKELGLFCTLYIGTAAFSKKAPFLNMNTRKTLLVPSQPSYLEAEARDLWNELPFLIGTSCMIFLFLQVQSETGCRSSCEQNTYDLTVGQAVVLPSNPEATPDPVFTHRVDLYVPAPKLTVREEYLLYDVSSFLADCAGMGGVLLGFSFLGMTDSLLKGKGKGRKGRKAATRRKTNPDKVESISRKSTADLVQRK